MDEPIAPPPHKIPTPMQLVAGIGVIIVLAGVAELFSFISHNTCTNCSPIAPSQMETFQSETAPKKFSNRSAIINPYSLSAHTPLPKITGTLASDTALAIVISKSPVKSTYLNNEKYPDVVWWDESDHGGGVSSDTEGYFFDQVQKPLADGKYYVGLYGVTSHYHADPSYFEGNSYVFLASSTLTVDSSAADVSVPPPLNTPYYDVSWLSASSSGEFKISYTNGQTYQQPGGVTWTATVGDLSKSDIDELTDHLKKYYSTIYDSTGWKYSMKFPVQQIKLSGPSADGALGSVYGELKAQGTSIRLLAYSYQITKYKDISDGGPLQIACPCSIDLKIFISDDVALPPVDASMIPSKKTLSAPTTFSLAPGEKVTIENHSCGFGMANFTLTQLSSGSATLVISNASSTSQKSFYVGNKPSLTAAYLLVSLLSADDSSATFRATSGPIFYCAY
jgi:hypothetical protein